MGQNAISRNVTQSRPRPRRSYRRVDGDVRREIERQARLPEPSAATAIQTVLDQDERFAGRVPPLRTIQAIARAAAVVDDSEPWRLDDGLGLSAGLILDVLAEVVEQTDGRRRHITRAEATWVVRIRRARPDLAPWAAYMLARDFMAGKQIEDDTLLLAFAPWRGDTNLERYERSVGDAQPTGLGAMFAPEVARTLQRSQAELQRRAEAHEASTGEAPVSLRKLKAWEAQERRRRAAPGKRGEA